MAKLADLQLLDPSKLVSRKMWMMENSLDFQNENLLNRVRVFQWFFINFSLIFRYEQTVEEPFHISKACIEANTSKGSVTSVFIEVDDEEFLICNLSDKILNETLDLNFNGGDKIVFKTTGNGTVHLTGYNIMQESGDDMYEDFSDEEESEEEDEEEEAPKLVNGKRKRSGKFFGSKNRKIVPFMRQRMYANLIACHLNALCSRNLQNVKLRLDFVEAW